MADRRIELLDDDVGERLDVVLVRRVPELSRARTRELFGEGRVRVGGSVVKKSHRVARGDEVTLEGSLPSVDFDALADFAMELSVVYENPDFVVVDKPVGMPSHPLREDERGTVANVLVARYPDMCGVGYRRREPGVVHRLDTNTSGLLLAARNRNAFDRLVEKLRTGGIEKHYRATCLGSVEAPDLIESPIATDPKNARRVVAVNDAREVKRLDARDARTEVLESVRVPEGSRVEVRANHARRHQVRVHLASIGHPLLGDVLYGAPQHPDGHHHLRATRIRLDWDGHEIDVKA
ncbi:MAG: RluA family pseudouridine synthase [Myxococcota bacterium]